MNIKKINLIAVFLIVFCLLCSCAPSFGDASGDTTAVMQEGETVSADFSEDPSEMFTERDLDSDFSDEKSAEIVLSDKKSSSTSDAVSISGSRVTIKDEGTYIVSGELSDGMLIVNADSSDKLRIVLDGTSINSNSSAALYIISADKVVVTLAEGSENSLSNGGEFTAIDDNNIDGAVFSKDDLTINGEGSLEVISPAGHGIVCKDDLVIAGGKITVQSSSHGIDANDSVRMTASSLTVEAGKDAVHAENDEDSTKGFVYILDGKFDLSGEGDGISASAHMQIEGGEFDIVTGGGSENAEKQTSDSWGGFPGGGFHGGPGRPGGRSVSDTAVSETSDQSTSIKGLKAGSGLLINGGDLTVDSADDAVHSNADLLVNGASFTLSSGDDAFHADGTLTVTAGNIEISESYEGLEGLHIKVTGGKVRLYASDDGFNAAGGTDESGFGGGRGDVFGKPGGMGSGSSDGSIVIAGGDIYINASGDGIDANGTFEMTGGKCVVCGPTQGDTATLDYDVSGTISGGTFIGTGASGMAQSFSASEQGVIAVSVGNQSATTKIIVEDMSGNIIIECEPELSFAVVIVSTPEIISGEEYKITVGTQSKTFSAS